MVRGMRMKTKDSLWRLVSSLNKAITKAGGAVNNTIIETAVRSLGWHATPQRFWQPIETAPKDRSILVTGPDGARIDQVIWGAWDLDNTHNWCDADGDRHPNAAITHWMPLPEPPK